MCNKKVHYHNFKQVLVYQIFKYFPEAITSFNSRLLQWNLWL